MVNKVVYKLWFLLQRMFMRIVFSKKQSHKSVNIILVRTDEIL